MNLMAHAEHPTPGHQLSRALVAGLALTLAFAAIEVVAGILSGSLALIADAGHMLVDSAGLLLALAATAIARRGADSRRTYGYARAEVLAVPVHVMLMLGLAAYIVYESFQRFGDDHSIEGWVPLVVGAIGLGINLFVLKLLHPHSHGNLNARGAMYEVAADTLGSIGVIVSAVVIIATGWYAVDIVISLAIGALIIPRAVVLLRQAVRILLEGAPPGVDVEQLTREAHAVPGVVALHDVHVWSIASGFTALSAHVEVETMADAERVVALLSALFRERHGISHVTLQAETHALHLAVECCEFPDAIVAPDHVHTA
jgi:cobalt-zinc-cadmium efflux system protein